MSDTKEHYRCSECLVSAKNCPKVHRDELEQAKSLLAAEIRDQDTELSDVYKELDSTNGQLKDLTQQLKDACDELDKAKADAQLAWSVSNAHREAALERDRLKEESAALKIRIEQHRGVLGYPVQGDIPDDPSIRCGLCDAKNKRINFLKAENEKLREALEKIASISGAPSGSANHDVLAIDYIASADLNTQGESRD